MARKIKKINERLDRIAAMRDQFDLIRKGDNKPILSRRRETSFSFVHDVDVIGREEDKEKIVELLLHSNDEEEKKLSVIPVVGMGGLGKTAFAKLVFNDERVENHFELRIWVCVSEEFELRKVIETLIKSATKGALIKLAENFSNLEMDALSAKLRKKIEGKRYLLVLDDVWNEDPSKWKELETLLRTGARGSKILVTTRSNKVAGIMGTVQAHKLEGLSHQKCMSLFVKSAFKEGQEERFPNLMEIGEHIVRKCGGVPLAVVTLATLLASTTDELEWIDVRDSEMWEQKESYILPSLKLSYDKLPSHLKKCFAYCAMFPKGHLFVQWELIPFWMAQGLLEPGNPNQEPEEVGLRYIRELGSRCFFQDFQELNGFLACKMHDLVHDLALSVSRGDILVVTSGSTIISGNVRHLSFRDPDSLPHDLPFSLQNSDHFRSFGTFASNNKGLVGSFVFSCLSRFKYLWVLDLIHSKFEFLPDSISTLKHLRFLRISWNRDLKQLPNSICKLHSLQTLFYDGCIQIKELPRDINYMISLRHLALTTKQSRLPQGGLGA